MIFHRAVRAGDGAALRALRRVWEGRSSRATSNCTTGRGLKRAWASRVCQCQDKGLLLYFAAGLGRRRCSGGGINSAVERR